MIKIVSESSNINSKTNIDQLDSIKDIKIKENSFGIFHILINTNQNMSVSLDKYYHINQQYNTPVYRVEILEGRQKNVIMQLVDYVSDNNGVRYADKLTESNFLEYDGSVSADILVKVPYRKSAQNIVINLYVSTPGRAEVLKTQRTITVIPQNIVVPQNPQDQFYMDIWQQPSILAKQYAVPLWGDLHFALIDKMASSLAKIGQKSISLIMSEDPWKGWGTNLIKNAPIDLYENSMLRVKMVNNQIKIDFSILDRYIKIFEQHNINQEYDLFGLIGLWDLPFYTKLMPDMEYHEPIIIRYLDVEKGTIDFLTSRKQIIEYITVILKYFNEHYDWNKVRILADEPSVSRKTEFKSSIEVINKIINNLGIAKSNFKVAFNNLDMLEEFGDSIDYIVTSFYATTKRKGLVDSSEFYVCNMPDKPNTFLSSSYNETRSIGLIAHFIGSSGMLRWAYNAWPLNATKSIDFNSSIFPVGDMELAYPDAYGNILNSVRMLAIYRGIEDFAILNQNSHIKVLDSVILNQNIEKWMSSENRIKNNTFDFSDKALDEMENLIVEESIKHHQ